MPRRTIDLLCTLLLLFLMKDGAISVARGEVVFEEKAASEVDRAALSPEGTALIAAGGWSHARSPHFWLHFQDRASAFAVAREAEFYYRIFLEEFKGGLASPPQPGAIRHLFIFDADRWGEAVKSLQFEEWTGAVTKGREIFLPRDIKARFKGNTLGHEVGHLCVKEHLGSKLPLWLEEGVVEEFSDRAYAAFHRARGYRAKPTVPAVEKPMPMATLLGYRSYPPPDEVERFYKQARRVTRFIEASGPPDAFFQLLKRSAKGEKFEVVLLEIYRKQWGSLAEMERAWLQQERK